MINPQSIALWCALPLAVAVSLDSLELLADRGQLREGGLYGYPVLATGRLILLRGPVARVLSTVFQYPAVLTIPTVQLLAATVFIAAGISRSSNLIVPAGVAATIILVARMLLYLRNQLGLDGSDQMILVVCTGIAVALLIPDRSAKAIALGYVAVQLLLSYGVAGVAKAISPVWRSGRALPGILSTIGYGNPSVGAWLRRNPSLSKQLCWSVILFECSAPFLILAGLPGAIIIIAVGISFHVGIAFFMGLNTFLWSFGAAYPALLLLALQIHSLLVR